MTKFAVTLEKLRKDGACVIGYNRVVRVIQGQAQCNKQGEE